MVCPGCGTENRSSRRFCLRCGRALAATCDACGAPNEREAAFCGECGVQLGGASRGPGAPAAVEAAPAPVAERRLVTVLFAVGPEVPEARAAAEEARAVFERVRAKVYLERLDAVMAGTFSADAATPGGGSTAAPAAATQPAG